jgi:ketosteroid isomerase-like protein
MDFNRRLALLGGSGALAGCASVAPPARFLLADRVAEVRAAETAFARAMADRDLAAFAALIADEAVFIDGGKALYGKAAIVDEWRRFFTAPAAPFAWKPEIVEVLASGALGYTQGPVWAPDGRVFTIFHSTWRRNEPRGDWQVVFDNGADVCKP